ncbi:hypothetical protein EJB05_32361, partial [Eragrostis curvula]
MATFRVAGASTEYLAITGWGVDDVKLAKKAWVWLGQRCKTLDVAPASYEMEAQGVTSENFPVVLRVVYTVGPKIDDKNQLGDQEPPLLLYAKLVALPSKKKEDCSSRVKELVQGALERHAGAVAAGMAADEILGEACRFAEDVLERVQLDLGKFGIHVYSANVKRLRVDMPASEQKMTHLEEELSVAQLEEWIAKLRLRVTRLEEERLRVTGPEERLCNDRLMVITSYLLEVLALRLSRHGRGAAAAPAAAH